MIMVNDLRKPPTAIRSNLARALQSSVEIKFDKSFVVRVGYKWVNRWLSRYNLLLQYRERRSTMNCGTQDE